MNGLWRAFLPAAGNPAALCKFERSVYAVFFLPLVCCLNLYYCVRLVYDCDIMHTKHFCLIPSIPSVLVYSGVYMVALWCKMI